MPDTPGTINFPVSLDTAVTLFEVANRAFTTLSGSIGASDLSIGVANGSLLPSTGAVTLTDSLTAPTKIEHVIYTVNSSNTLTVPSGGRGFGGSTAQSWSGTVYVRVRALAQHHSTLRGAIIALETKLGTGSATATANTVLRGTGSGTTDFGTISNAYVASDAAIALSKLATVTASRALISDVSGVVSASAVTATELGYVGGVTSAIQTQIDGKQPLDSDLTAIAALTTTAFGRGLLTESSASTLKTTLSLGNVENTALSTWTGSTNLTTLGTITSGTWNGAVIGAAYGGAGTVNGILKANGAGTVSAAVAGTDYASAGAVTSSGLTMATARLLGRSTASTGAIEEITVGSGLSLSAGTLTATGGGITVGTTTITSGTTTRVLYNNAGVVGEYAVTGTGNAVLSASPTLTGTVAAAGATFSGTIVQTSSSATAFESGPNGSTNPVFRLVNSTASSATGLSITGNAAGSGVTLTALSSGATEDIIFIPKGTTGSLRLNNSVPQFHLNTFGLFYADGGGVYLRGNGPGIQLQGVSGQSFPTSGAYFEFSGGIRMRSPAAATLTFGAADAAAPVAQTLSVQNVVAGTTNAAGATWTMRGSLGTSQGVPGRIHLAAGAMIAASGTTQQTAVDRAIFNATKVLTNNSATTITNVTAAASGSAGGQLGYYIEVTDGTDYQYEVGVVSFGVTNKGGVFSGNTCTKFGDHQNVTSGTLTVTFAISGANPAVLSVNANSSLSPSTGYPRIVYWMMSGSNQAVSIQS